MTTIVTQKGNFFHQGPFCEIAQFCQRSHGHTTVIIALRLGHIKYHRVRWCICELKSCKFQPFTLLFANFDQSQESRPVAIGRNKSRRSKFLAFQFTNTPLGTFIKDVRFFWNFQRYLPTYVLLMYYVRFSLTYLPTL